MKKLFSITIVFLSFSVVSMAQDSIQKRSHEKVTVKKVNVKRIDAKKIAPKVVRPDAYEIFGNFEVTDYDVLSIKTAAKKELNALIGTLVKVDSSSVTGQLIDPRTFTIYEICEMSSSDYIYRAFGREIRAPEPDLPKNVQVHKVDHEDCYGIINLGHRGIAIPYKGVLLFLKRK